MQTVLHKLMICRWILEIWKTRQMLWTRLRRWTWATATLIGARILISRPPIQSKKEEDLLARSSTKVWVCEQNQKRDITLRKFKIESDYLLQSKGKFITIKVQAKWAKLKNKKVKKLAKLKKIVVSSVKKFLKRKINYSDEIKNLTK